MTNSKSLSQKDFLKQVLNNEIPVIICVLWANQRVPSVQRACTMCPQLVALDKLNAEAVAAQGMKPICELCFHAFLLPHIKPGETEIRGMIGGESLSVKDALKAAEAIDAILSSTPGDSN